MEGRYRRRMLDIKLIRSEPDAVKAAIARRGDDTSAIDDVLEADAAVREIGTRRDEIRSEINRLSKEVGALHRDGRGDEAGSAPGARRKIVVFERGPMPESGTATKNPPCK